MTQAGNTIGKVVGINGNLVSVEVTQGADVLQNEVAYVDLEGIKLKSEVIKVQDRICHLQVFEDTRGIRVGMPVEFTGEMLVVELAPGVLNNIYDGLQNPLKELDNKNGFFLKRGQYLPAISLKKKWRFHPTAKPGEVVRAGSWLGWVPEQHFKHRIMAPFGMLGTATVESVVPEGDYEVRDTVAVLTDDQGHKINVTMYQTWPVKKAIKAYKQRLYPEEQLVTACRIIDTMFPVGRGGVACIPGPFGAGKTVLQHLLSKFAQVDIVIVVACGERAGEVVELIYEFPEMDDPKTGGKLMERTIIICNTSSMPVAARDASIYTGVTLGEYYRQMGYDVLVLADSTSRWAQAMREMSGRLEEIPGEEAFPAYLESRVANIYERAGLVELQNGDNGAVTLIGTVSPAGGNFEEPVTQATLKVVGAFLGLSRSRSDQRRFPAIDPLDSWSLYLDQLKDSLDRDLDPHWVEMVTHASSTLRRSSEVSKMMTVVGEEGISIGDLVTYLKGEMLDMAYLQQNAFDDVDAATPMKRQVRDFKLLYEAMSADFDFETKLQARQFFAELQDAFYQKNYVAEDSEDYRKYEEQIRKMLQEGASRV
ncbi:MAG: V-type ATP synthase subunit A [Deltaproteobacteria bacterium]|nr:V-type ATP synthase subunit A [Deltaproteobacteria bacterium]